jgi:large subunit ribosomal protein L4
MAEATTIPVYNREGEIKSSIEVPRELKGAIHSPVLWQAVRMYLANRRQGTADTKRRGEVRGGGKKPYRQKHTGRARAGSIRSPLWRKGGIVFGPHPRSYRYELPKRIRRLALLNSLRDKVQSQAVALIEGLDDLEPKTKLWARLFGKLGFVNGKFTLLVVENPSDALQRGVRNLTHLAVRCASDLNSYEVLRAHRILATVEGWKRLKERLRS